MLKFEAILIDPSPGEIAERLSDATAAANKRCRTRLLADDPAKWRKFARQVQAGPEGFDLFRGGKGGVPGTQVVAAWWTDTIGRKHVVLRGRRVEHDDAKVLLHRDALARRPPLWHCYPQHVYQRFVPTSDWIAVCGCGAVGTPAALGWMGDVCGPCHDHREDFGADSLRDNRPGWLPGVRNPFVAVAFGRGGTKVAGVEDLGPISVWEIADSISRTRLDDLGRREERPPIIAFAGESDEYLYCSSPYNTNQSGTCIYDLRNPNPKPCFSSLQEEGYLIRPWPTKSADRMIDWGNHVLHLRTTLPTLEVLHYRLLGPSYWLPPAAEPAPRFLPLVQVDGVRILDSLTLAEVAFAPYSDDRRPDAHMYQRFSAAYHEPTRTVFVARGRQLEAYDAGTRTHRPTLSMSRLPPGAVQNYPQTITALALSPDDRWLFAAAGERLVVIDPASLDVVAVFAWHLGPIACLAVSPDGRTLATAGVEGVVKLWPIDRLLAP